MKIMTHTSQRFCLRWNNHQSNLLSVFDQLLHDESFVDVTLAVEGQFLRAHKMVLSACSPYFQALFVNHPDKHPIVILKDVPFADMRSLLDFMYRGEVSVDQDRLTAFLKVAESLRIKGLTEVNEEKCDLPSIASSLLSNNHQRQTASPPSVPPPPPNLHRIHLSQPSSLQSSSSNSKRCAPSPSNFSVFAGNSLTSSLYSQKRKRGRPRKLSGSSDTPSAASPEHELNTDSDNRHSVHSNLSESSYAHGPPDLLEVNMTEHSQISPSSFCEEQNLGTSEQDMIHDTSDECCVKTEPNEESSVPGTSFQDCKSPLLKDSSSSRSQSQTPTNQSERYPPDKCHWKEILKRLKKPEISIRVENNDIKQQSEEQSISNRIIKSEITNSKNITTATAATVAVANNNISKMYSSQQQENYYSTESLAAGSSSSIKDTAAVWYTDSNSTSSYYIEPDGDDLEDEDEAMLKYEYEALRSSVVGGNNGNNSSPGNATGGSVASSGSVHVTENTKPLDKSSVRRYCVQVAEHLFQCTLCYKTYTHISNFSRHFLSAHHGLRQEIPCPVCYRIFTRRDNMLTHMKQVHRITVTRGLATSLIQKLSSSNENTSNSTENQVNSN